LLICGLINKPSDLSFRFNIKKPLHFYFAKAYTLFI